MKRQVSRATAKVLLRAWDSHSYSRLSLLPNVDLGPKGDGFDSSAYENDDVLEQNLNRLDEQAAALKALKALKAHAIYKDYNVCFIIM